MRVQFRLECKEPSRALLEEFGIAERTLRRSVKDKLSWSEKARNKQALRTKRRFYAKYPAIDEELLRFVKYARNLRLPMTRHLIQERAKIVAMTVGVNDFQTSNGYIEKFIRRWNLHKSVRLHGRGGSALPPSHE